MAAQQPLAFLGTPDVSTEAPVPPNVLIGPNEFPLTMMYTYRADLVERTQTDLVPTSVIDHPSGRCELLSITPSWLAITQAGPPFTWITTLIPWYGTTIVRTTAGAVLPLGLEPAMLSCQRPGVRLSATENVPSAFVLTLVEPGPGGAVGPADAPSDALAAGRAGVTTGVGSAAAVGGGMVAPAAGGGPKYTAVTVTVVTCVLVPATVTLPSLTVAKSSGAENATAGDGGGGETT